MTLPDGAPERPGGLAYEIAQSDPDRTNAVYVDGDLVATGRRVEVRVGDVGEWADEAEVSAE